MNKICSECSMPSTELMRQLCGVETCPRDVEVTELSNEEAESFFAELLVIETKSPQHKEKDSQNFLGNSEFSPL